MHIDLHMFVYIYIYTYIYIRIYIYVHIMYSCVGESWYKQILETRSWLYFITAHGMPILVYQNLESKKRSAFHIWTWFECGTQWLNWNIFPQCSQNRGTVFHIWTMSECGNQLSWGISYCCKTVRHYILNLVKGPQWIKANVSHKNWFCYVLTGLVCL